LFDGLAIEPGASGEILETKAEQLSPQARASEVAGTLEVSFIHNAPDLRIEVPPIPG
jgi:hypothetical protein